MSYYRDCTTCGQKIFMTQDHYGRWQPLEPDGSGRHVHWSGADDGWKSSPTSQSRSWSLATLDRPLTFPTTCRWCEEPVFYHTNGNGDSVLFDRLGWPWAVHACWLSRRGDREEMVGFVEDHLEQRGYDGDIYPLESMRVDPPGRSWVAVAVRGFVVSNDAFLTPPLGVRFEATDGADTRMWYEVEVETEDGARYPFWLPERLALDLDLYVVVELTGQWLKHQDDWHLLPIELRRRTYPRGRERVERVTSLSPPLSCSYCRRMIRGGIGWGFDPDDQVECERCSRMRGELAPRRFVELCHRIAVAPA